MTHQSNTLEIAHDICGLTTSLVLASERLASHQDRAVVAEARRLSDLTNRILEICQCELVNDFKPEPHTLECLTLLLADIDLAIVPARVSEFEPYEVLLQVEGEIAFDCNAPMLFRVLYNLIVNAAAAVEGVDSPRIDIFATQHERRLYVQVADNGRGMPEKVAQSLRTMARGDTNVEGFEGSGLLSTIKLLHRNGGSLKLINTGPDGTRMGFFLPVVPDNRLRAIWSAYEAQVDV